MLHQHEKLVASALLSGAKTVDEICSASKLGRDSAVRALYWLKGKGAVEFSEEARASLELGEEGKRFCREGFPERRLLAKVAARGEADFSLLDGEELSIGLPWAKKLGWIEIFSTQRMKEIRATGKGRAELAAPYPPEEACKKLLAGKPLSEAESRAAEALAARGDIVSRRERTEIANPRITPEGERLVAQEGPSGGKAEVNQLTRELIATGKWRDVALRGYDLGAPVEKIYPAKPHPLKRIVSRLREIFIELGFEEMEGNVIESSFWNFDALFQPQDHPARELADTFYLMSPDRMEIPDPAVAKRVAKAHEKGWKYKWKKEVAEQPVLRTHTTALSARYVAEAGKGERKAPGKYFAVGRVYRNEATDFKHLAEFQMVEGIVVDEDATFPQLLGVLREFYRKLGFEKIRFRPHYFPYTEPSLEVDVFYEPKGEWMELGGAGVFRPEVCLPLWGKYPVLAWGLSLERPAMIMMGLDDMRAFYKNDLGWLRETPASGAGLG
ncbi:MAG: phenylalanine--tRNA ligase subunit alpha [Candidatus ainarchaeum sp.]|nr:phenylalanine--tRNA ligase subunit alpha [Candidatus ainarchaeum sp.]